MCRQVSLNNFVAARGPRRGPYNLRYLTLFRGISQIQPRNGRSRGTGRKQVSSPVSWSTTIWLLRMLAMLSIHCIHEIDEMIEVKVGKVGNGSRRNLDLIVLGFCPRLSR